jgi:hypothetical protein
MANCNYLAGFADSVSLIIVLVIVMNDVLAISRDGILNRENGIIKAILAVISQTKANFCVK